MPGTAEIRRASLMECFISGRVKGSVIRPHIDWVRDHGDRAEVIEFFHEILPSMRAVSAAGWYPFEDLILLDRVIINRFGNGESHCLDEIGRYAAKHAVGLSRPSLGGSGIHDHLQHSASLHYESHDFGNAVYRELGAREGQFLRTNWTSFSPLYCGLTIAFYRESIRLLGGAEVEVWESQCQCGGDESCTFEMMWS